MKIFGFPHLTEACRLDFRPNRAGMECEIEENEDFAPVRTASPRRPHLPVYIGREGVT